MGFPDFVAFCVFGCLFFYCFSLVFTAAYIR